MDQPSDRNIYEQLKNDVRRIAVHSGNLIVGDTVMLNPLVRSLRDSFPDVPIDYIGYVQPFVVNFVRRVLPVNDFVKLELKKNLISAAAEFFPAIRKLRRREYDLIIDNQFIAINTLILKLSRKRWLLSQCGGGFLSDLQVPAKTDLPKHIIDRSIAPLRHIGLPYVYDKPLIKIENSERTLIDRVLEINGFSPNLSVIGVAPYSGHEIKNWQVANFIELLKILSDRGFGKFIIFTSANQLERAKSDFRTANPDIGFSTELIPESEDIDKVVPLLARMNLFIANDSGLAHVSSALGVPTIAIFGPTSPDKFAPRGEKVKIIHSSSLCSPCDIYKPCRNNRQCFNGINPDFVYKESLNLTEE